MDGTVGNFGDGLINALADPLVECLDQPVKAGPHLVARRLARLWSRFRQRAPCPAGNGSERAIASGELERQCLTRLSRAGMSGGSPKQSSRAQPVRRDRDGRQPRTKPCAPHHRSPTPPAHLT